MRPVRYHLPAPERHTVAAAGERQLYIRPRRAGHGGAGVDLRESR